MFFGRLGESHVFMCPRSGVGGILHWMRRYPADKLKEVRQFYGTGLTVIYSMNFCNNSGQ